MNRIKKVVATLGLTGILLTSSIFADTGVIVNLNDEGAEIECTDSKVKSGTQFDRGIIVNLTGVIVNLTGVIVNFTGVIVNFTDTKEATCGHLPTGD